MNEEHNTRLSATVDKLLSGKSEYRTAAHKISSSGYGILFFLSLEIALEPEKFENADFANLTKFINWKRHSPKFAILI